MTLPFLPVKGLDQTTWLRRVTETINGILGGKSGIVSNSISLIDGITEPSTNSFAAQIYVDTADGDLKVKFGDGTVKTIVIDT